MMQTQTAEPGMESFAALFEESLKSNDIRVGEVISAEVVRIDPNGTLLTGTFNGISASDILAIAGAIADPRELAREEASA